MAKPRRNDFCPCGSGKKYKKCCINNSFLSLELEIGSKLEVSDISIEKVPEAQAKGWTGATHLRCQKCFYSFSARNIRKMVDKDGEFWLLCPNEKCLGSSEGFEKVKKGKSGQLIPLLALGLMLDSEKPI